MPGSIHRCFARHAIKDARLGKRASKHASGVSSDLGFPAGVSLAMVCQNSLLESLGLSHQKGETGARGPGHSSRSIPYPISLGAPLFYFSRAGYNTNSLVLSSRDQYSWPVADWPSRPQQ